MNHPVLPSAAVLDAATSAAAYVLLLCCPDQPGIVHAFSGALAAHGGNIEDSAQFADPVTGSFYMRVHFSAPAGFRVSALEAELTAIGNRLRMTWTLHEVARRARVVLLVSKFGHCLNDLLFRQRSGQLSMDIPAIVSNHRDFETLAQAYGVPFHYLPVSPDRKAEQERAILDVVDQTGADLVVLARYMQVLSDDMCRKLAGRAINIHHSFLPGFKGARPYHQAYDRGVKVIGATAHYVTADLDEGPIIEQEVHRVDHSRTPQQLTEAGRDTECIALARAVQWHIEHRVIINGSKTVVFR